MDHAVTVAKLCPTTTTSRMNHHDHTCSFMSTKYYGRLLSYNHELCSEFHNKDQEYMIKISQKSDELQKLQKALKQIESSIEKYEKEIDLLSKVKIEKSVMNNSKNNVAFNKDNAKSILNSVSKEYKLLEKEIWARFESKRQRIQRSIYDDIAIETAAKKLETSDYYRTLHPAISNQR